MPRSKPPKPGAPRPAPSSLAVHRFAHEAMTTVFEVFIAGKARTYAGQAARAAFDEIDRIESLFNRFDPSSEISRISRLAPGERMMIGIETLECLGVAAQVQDETCGAFDINYRTLTLPRPRLLDLISLHRVSGGFEVVRLASHLPRGITALDLDLGALGKGYAVDSAMDVLDEWGVSNALVHAGTSTALAVGPGPSPPSRRRGWPVGIASPSSCPGAPRVVRLLDRALSGSGTEVKGAHIVDPRTGRPVRRRPAAFASHPSAAVSDALSTAFFVMRPPEIAAYCTSHPEVWALVILGRKKCKIFSPAAIR